MVVDENRAIADSARYEIARKLFISDEYPDRDFLSYVKIVEPPQPLVGNLGGVVDFEKWEHTKEMARALSENRQVCVLKSRQIGFSWVVAAYAIWMAHFHKGSVVLMLSKGEAESHALLEKARQVYVNLPENWKVPVGTDSRSEMSFPSMKSKIMALPATEDAGRSETASVVIQDEADFHFYLSQNIAAFKPTIDAGGQIIMGSTSNKRKASSLFKSIFKASDYYRGTSEWKGLFFGWDARPGRDQEWYERTRASIPEDELAEMSPDLYMEQEYPRSAEEALAPTRALAHFNTDFLKAMERDVREPRFRYDYLKKDRETAYWNLYVAREAGHRYVAASDTSHGVGRDYSVSAVVDLNALCVVADIVDNTIEPDEFAELSMQMLEHYHNPLWAIEVNDLGQVVADKARELGYKRLYHRKTQAVKGGKRSTKREPGWRTDISNRTLMWGDLKQVVDSGRFTVYSKIGMNQFFDVINDKRIEAASGAHDDYPTACAIAYQMRHEVAKRTGKTIREPAVY